MEEANAVEAGGGWAPTLGILLVRGGAEGGAAGTEAVRGAGRLRVVTISSGRSYGE